MREYSAATHEGLRERANMREAARHRRRKPWAVLVWHERDERWVCWCVYATEEEAKESAAWYESEEGGRAKVVSR